MVLVFGSGNLVASAAPCSTPSSGALIESTIIPNFQLTNNATQLAPMDILTPSQVNSAKKINFGLLLHLVLIF